MFSQEQIFEKTKDELKRLMRHVKLAPEHSSTFFNQAFGVVQFACQLAPEYENELFELWEQYEHEYKLY